MTKDFARYCAVHSYCPGNSGYTEPLGHEEVCVYADGVRHVYSAPPAATKAAFRYGMIGFRKWAKTTFRSKNGNRITGRFPTYYADRQ